MMDLSNRVVRTPVRPEAIRARLEIRLEDRLQHQLKASLDHPVSNGRDTELTKFPVRFRYQNPAHFDRPELTRLQRIPDLPQELLDPHPGLDLAAVARSTPGVLAPLFVATRSHATRKN